MSVLIIAEAGCNHNGKLDTALRLCDAAKAAGADIVKTQTFNPGLLFKSPRISMKAREFCLSYDDTVKMAEHCDSIGIEFCSTPDGIRDLELLVKHCGMKRIKLGSGSLLYEPLVDAAFDTGLPVLLSTGMATLAEIYMVLMRQWNRKYKDGKTGRPLNHVTAMHCVSLYPCPPHLANIKAIDNLRDMNAWSSDCYAVGYSDHTIGNYAILSAVALGATVVEKHFTLDNEADGPDHRMSAMPEQFERMVMKIRQTEVVLGHGRKDPSEEELAMIPRIRKSAEGFQPGL